MMGTLESNMEYSIPDNNHPAGIAGSILVPELKHSILISCNLSNLILKQHIQLQSLCKVMEVTHLETAMRWRIW